MYYCLIASLEQYTLSSDARKIDFAELRGDIMGELSKTDLSAAELLYSYYDVENLLSALWKRSTPHNVLGNLSEEEIRAEIETKGSDDEPFVSKLPVSVRYALDLVQGRVEVEEEDATDYSKISELDVEKLLLSNFYSLVAQSKCAYLKRFVELDRQMRSYIAGVEGAVGGYPEEPREQVWYTELSAVIETRDFVEREHKMDALRWRIAAELTEAGGLDGLSHDFDIAAVLNYLIEINILHRWAMLSKEIGRERFKTMVASFTSKGMIDIEQ